MVLDLSSITYSTSKKILYLLTDYFFFLFLGHLFVFSSPESSLDSQTDMESTGQQSEDATLPSTSQDPGNVFGPLTII